MFPGKDITLKDGCLLKKLNLDKYNKCDIIYNMITEYEIVAKGIPENVSEYEEITVEDFLKRENATENEIITFHNTYNAINIHIMVSNNTLDQVRETLQDSLTDPRLAGLNAIVMLSLKQCGRGKAFETLSQEKFAEIINFALDNKIRFGMDSCSCKKFLDVVKNHPNFKEFSQVAEPCESSLFSAYISVDGIFSACSFAPGKSFDLDATKTPFTELLNHPEVVKFRNNLINTKNGNELNCRECPIYQI